MSFLSGRKNFWKQCSQIEGLLIKTAGIILLFTTIVKILKIEAFPVLEEILRACGIL